MAVILVAEDDKAMQEIIIDYMRRGSHTCIAADDGIDAMAILKSNTVDLAAAQFRFAEFALHIL